MRVPLSWLREFVPFDLPVDELTNRLTMAGLEVSSVERIGDAWDREKILVGRATAVRPHPNADRLTLVDVDYGGGRTITVVTGAPNMKIGQPPVTIALALAGATLWDTHADPPALAVLKPAKIRGVASAGMVCSERELGISEEHTGIMLLPDDAPVGMPLTDYLGETVLTLELTPNLSRCLSIAGVAREVAAFTGAAARIPSAGISWIDPPASEELEIAIVEPDLCARYCGIVIDRVTIAPSPFPLAWRLKLAGQRPINNVVDITNYVMFELGQPLHAFDFATIGRSSSGRRRIEVRRARDGERLTTLDGQDRALDAATLVIADPGRAVALAGVMGGENTEVSGTTTSVLLEAATFDPISIARTSRALKLPSQASLRFSKGVWPDLAEEGALRAAELFARHAGGKVRRGIVQDYPRPAKRRAIRLRAGEVPRILGIDVPQRQTEDALTRLGFALAAAGDGWDVTPPPWRLDCSIPADLVEEVARLHGYEDLPERLLPLQLPPTRRKAGASVRDRVRDRLVRLGFSEIVSYAMISPEQAAAAGYDPEGDSVIRLVNPLSRDRCVLRPSLLPSILSALAANFRFRDRLAHFEVGAVFSRGDGKAVEEERVAIGCCGYRRPLWWGWGERETMGLFDVKGALQALFGSEGMRGIAFRPARVPMLDPERTLEMLSGDEVVGVLGEVDAATRSLYDLPPLPVAVAQLTLSPFANVPWPPPFAPILRYPPVVIDLALTIPDSLSSASVTSAVAEAAGPLLVGLVPFDLYRGPQVPAAHRSVAYRLTFQSPERSLVETEVLAIREGILRVLSPLGVTVR